MARKVWAHYLVSLGLSGSGLVFRDLFGQLKNTLKEPENWRKRLAKIGEKLDPKTLDVALLLAYFAPMFRSWVFLLCGRPTRSQAELGLMGGASFL